MAPAITALSWIWAGLVAGGGYVVAALNAGGVYGFVARTVAVVLLSSAVSKLFGPKASFNGITGTQLTVRSGLEYRKIVYGQAMVSGPIVYNNTRGGLFSINEDLYYVVAMADHACEDLVSVWLDGAEILKSEIDWTAGTAGADGTGSGDVSNTDYIGENAASALGVLYYLGHANQVASAELVTGFTEWTSAHRLRGVTYVIYRLTYTTDTEKIWASGTPRNYKALLKGRQIYDPRLDTTHGFGTGSHDYTDAATWEWSDNPALCVADYLITYMAVDPATAIDWPAVVSAADDCDVLVDIPVAATENRFTCNGVLSLGSTHRDNLNALLGAMDGKLSYSAGLWKVRASVWEAASVSIVADDLAGDVDIRGAAPKKERFNSVRGFYADPARQYEYVEFDHVTDATYLARDDGESISYDLQLQFTNSEYMCQRLAFRNLDQSDAQILANLTLNARGAKVAIGDIVDITLADFGWSAKTFRVVEWAFNPNGTYKILCKEDIAANYVDPVEGDYTQKTNDVIVVPDITAIRPTGLTATAVTGGVGLAWTNPISSRAFHIEIWVANENVRASAAIIATTQAESFIDTISNAERIRYYWIRAMYTRIGPSLYLPNATTTGKIAYPLIRQGAIVADPFIRQGGSYWDVSDSHVTYQAGAGLDGTDVVRVQLGTWDAVFLTAPRRGPDIWDVFASGMFSIEIRFRRKIQADPGGVWSAPAAVQLYIDDENGSNPLHSGPVALYTFSEADTTGVWRDESYVVEVQDTLPPPRFMRIEVLYGSGDISGNTYIDHDFIEATITARTFDGSNTIGLVPNPGTSSGKYLKDDGTWDAPPGGSGGVTVQDEGTPLATLGTTLNFTGAGVTASGTGATKTINVPAGGTVTSVTAGNGMNFTSITGSGPVTLGTPSSLSPSSTNISNPGTHEHVVSGFALDSHAHVSGDISNFAAAVAANSAVALNTAKTTNQNHSGDIAGSTTLTIQPSAISSRGAVTPIAGDYVLLWDATDATLKRANVTDFISGDAWTNIRLTSDFVSSLTANTRVTGLDFTPLANKTYLVEFFGLVRTATTTVGARPGWAFSAGLTDWGAIMQAPNSTTALATRTWGTISTANAGSTGLTDTTSSWMVRGEAILVVGGSPVGTLGVTLASETGGTNVTMKAGSVLRYREIA